ncbi:RloB family protein [Streptomyces sp. NPDC001868]|uniref:RloB family protein n=1 Tax=Streptomyces sp. NPDC001868 TaxID=3154401 RepID=UPI00331C88E9
MSRQGRPLKRRTQSKPANKKVLVFFEGEVTERLYVNGLRRMLRGHPIHIDPGNSNGEPLSLVRSTIKRAKEVRSGDSYDDVWCLFDVETPPHGSLDSALSLAAKNDINCAVSNPCFELWLLLHATSHNRHMTTSGIIKLAEKELPSYTRKSFKFEDFEPHIGIALKRALELEKNFDPDEQAQNKNPSTSMWKFIQMLQKHGGISFDSELK